MQNKGLTAHVEYVALFINMIKKKMLSKYEGSDSP